MEKDIAAISKAFDQWNKIFPSLQKQPFVYAYEFYGIGELMNKPSKGRANKIPLKKKYPVDVFASKRKRHCFLSNLTP